MLRYKTSISFTILFLFTFETSISGVTIVTPPKNNTNIGGNNPGKGTTSSGGKGTSITGSSSGGKGGSTSTVKGGSSGTVKGGGSSVSIGGSTGGSSTGTGGSSGKGGSTKGKTYKGDLLSKNQLIKTCGSRRTKLNGRDFSTIKGYKNYKKLCEGRVKSRTNIAGASGNQTHINPSISSGDASKLDKLMLEKMKKYNLVSLLLAPLSITKHKFYKKVLSEKLKEYNYKAGTFSKKGMTRFLSEVEKLPLSKIKRLPKWVLKINQVSLIVKSKKQKILEKYEEMNSGEGKTEIAGDSSSDDKGPGSATASGGDSETLQVSFPLLQYLRGDYKEQETPAGRCAAAAYKAFAAGGRLDQYCCDVLTGAVKKSILDFEIDQAVSSHSAGVGIAAAALLTNDKQAILSNYSSGSSIPIGRPNKSKDLLAQLKGLEKGMKYISFGSSNDDYDVFKNTLKSKWGGSGGIAALKYEMKSVKTKLTQAEEVLSSNGISNTGHASKDKAEKVQRGVNILGNMCSPSVR